MIVTANPPQAGPAQEQPPRRRRLAAIIAAVTVLAAGAGIGIGLAVSGGGSSSGPASPAAASYSYYQSMMGRYGTGSGSMMGGTSYLSMMGRSGYTWMMGGANAPGWMTGGTLPSSMMGASTDMGKVMGQLFADAPGPRVSATQATALAQQIPAGATVDSSANRITFTTTSVNLVVAASPSMPAENFRIAGLTNPTVVVPKGAKVTVTFVNADSDMAHGLVVSASRAASSWMPMMSAPQAFSGSAVWFLGESTSAGMHTGTVSFTAATPGAYEYLCPVPGHAQKGMAGNLIVR